MVTKTETKDMSRVNRLEVHDVGTAIQPACRRCRRDQVLALDLGNASPLSGTLMCLSLWLPQWLRWLLDGWPEWYGLLP